MSAFGEGTREREVKNDILLECENLSGEGFTKMQIIKILVDVLSYIMEMWGGGND